MTRSRGIRPPYLRWTAEQIEIVRVHYSNMTAQQVAQMIGRDEKSVYFKAKRLGLRKSAEFLASAASGRLGACEHPNSVATRFKKGQVPPNKGLRRPGYSPGRMAQTQFKKGRPASKARNYVPIGTEKIDPKRNVLMRKMTDDPALFPACRWRPVHVLVWEAAHGSVPPKHIVRFRDGMKTFDPNLITLDRLELVSLEDNMRRNTIHNLPAPLVEVIYLNTAVKRRIANRERKSA